MFATLSDAKKVKIHLHIMSVLHGECDFKMHVNLSLPVVDSVVYNELITV